MKLINTDQLHGSAHFTLTSTGNRSPRFNSRDSNACHRKRPLVNSVDVVSPKFIFTPIPPLESNSSFHERFPHQNCVCISCLYDLIEIFYPIVISRILLKIQVIIAYFLQLVTLFYVVHISPFAGPNVFRKLCFQTRVVQSYVVFSE